MKESPTGKKKAVTRTTKPTKTKVRTLSTRARLDENGADRTEKNTRGKVEESGAEETKKGTRAGVEENGANLTEKGTKAKVEEKSADLTEKSTREGETASMKEKNLEGVCWAKYSERSLKS